MSEHETAVGGRAWTRRRLMGTVPLLGAAALAVACESPGGEATPPESGATGPAASSGKDVALVFGAYRDLVNGPEDPYFAHNQLNIWESLTYLDNNLVAQPLLTESYQMAPDGRSWTFKLRPNIKFHDGTPFDAGAVVANIERYAKISPRRSSFTNFTMSEAYGDFEKVEAVDAMTVRISTSTPTPALSNMMSNFYSAMFSPASFDDQGNFTGPPATTAPYRISDWKRGEYSVLTAFDGYRGGAPAVKQITVRALADPSTRVNALKAEEVDALMDLGAVLPEQAEGIKRDPNLRVGTQEIALSHYLYVHGAKEPFNDVRVRRALNMAIDREALVKNTLLGYGVPGRSVIPPVAKRWARTDLKPPFDPNRARSLAQEALGGKMVKALLLLSTVQTTRYPYKSIAEIMQQAWRPLGFDVEIRTVDQAAWTQALRAGEYDISFSTQSLPNGDPDLIFSRYLASNGSTATARNFGYQNAEADALIASAARELDQAKLKAAYDRLQQIAQEDAVFTPLFYDVLIFGYKAKVQNYTVDVNYKPSFPKLTVK
ncbi:MAG: ABC transporter substrate-binding protein [Chloroflexota bacterium]